MATNVACETNLEGGIVAKHGHGLYDTRGPIGKDQKHQRTRRRNVRGVLEPEWHFSGNAVIRPLSSDENTERTDSNPTVLSRYHDQGYRRSALMPHLDRFAV